MSQHPCHLSPLTSDSRLDSLRSLPVSLAETLDSTVGVSSPPAALTCGGRGRRRRRLLLTALADAREAVLLAQHGLPLGQRASLLHLIEADVAVRDLGARGHVARRDHAQRRRVVAPLDDAVRVAPRLGLGLGLELGLGLGSLDDAVRVARSSERSWLRRRPAGAPEASFSARSRLRLPQAPASLGQATAWVALAARAALAGHVGLGLDLGSRE